MNYTYKRTRHADETYAVFYGDRKVGHIMKTRDGYGYTPERVLGREHILLTGNDKPFNFDEAFDKIKLRYNEWVEAVNA